MDFYKLIVTDVPRGKYWRNNQPRKALNAFSVNEVFAKLTAPVRTLCRWSL